MAHFAVASSAPYQTYARPLAGGKRKRKSTSKSNQSESIEHDATSTAARSRRSRPHKDKYNPKYKAEMCLSAYKARLHQAGFAHYNSDIAGDWQEDLVEIFSHAASKGTIKQDAATRHVIPRLVFLVPRTNEKKDELVRDFAKHYENVRRELVVIEKIMDTGYRVDEDSIAEVRECLYGLHNALDKGVKWRNIISYTPLPLPLHRLRVLRDLIEYSRPYHFLRDLVTNIDDIEDWLTSPPASLTLSTFPTKLVNGVMEVLQEATKDRIAKTSIGSDAQQTAKYLEQKAERQSLEKEEHDRQQERACLEKVQRLEAEQEQMKKDIKALELVIAKERAQENMRKLAEAAALAELKKSYQNQISRNTTEIGRLSTDLIKLASGQAEETKPNVASMPSLPISSGRFGTVMGSSFSSNQTANSSVYQPQSSVGTSFSSSMGDNFYSQPGSFERISHQPTPEDDGVPMEHIQGIGTPQQYPTNLCPTGLFRPGMRIAGQPNPFSVHIGNGVPSQLPGLSDGDFKPTCQKYRNGYCPLGRSCKMPHTACKFWLNGNCRYGGKCIRSHDPFFLTEAASRSGPQQSSRIEQMVVDSDPATRSSPFPQANPFQSGRQNRIHASQASNGMNLSGHQAPPTGPRERTSTINRITKDGQSILSRGPNFASTSDSNAFGQRGVLLDAVQETRVKAASKKLACKNNLKGRCNKGDNCQYAHQPCQEFVNDTYRFGDDRGRKSHDPALLDQVSSNNGGRRLLQLPSRQQPPQILIEQSLDDIIQAGGGSRNEKYGKPRQPQSSARHQRPQDHIEHSLDDMIQTAGRGRKKKQANSPQSETPCRWQMTPNGCTNDRCPYKHEPPKTSDLKALQGTFGLPNLWGSIGNILRGNRQ